MPFNHTPTTRPRTHGSRRPTPPVLPVSLSDSPEKKPVSASFRPLSLTSSTVPQSDRHTTSWSGQWQTEGRKGGASGAASPTYAVILSKTSGVRRPQLSNSCKDLKRNYVFYLQYIATIVSYVAALLIISVCPCWDDTCWGIIRISW